jgi:hypothetical protein
MSEKLLPTEQVLAMLVEGPSRLLSLTAGLMTNRLHTPSTEGAWSVNDILAHLRSCADVWGNCIVMILNEDRPTIRAVNPATWIKQTDYLELDFHHSLQAFRTQRAELSAVLEPLAPERWARTATVTGAGKPLQRSVQFYAQWLATHERSHLTHLGRLVKTALT